MAHPCCLCGEECHCSGDIDDCIVSLTPPGCESCGCQEDDDLHGDDDYDPDEELVEYVCRECGCRNDMACMQPDHGPCWWVQGPTFDEKGNMTEGPLCSHCFHKFNNVDRPWQENENQR